MLNNQIQVFSKEWFIKYQRLLLLLANTSYGRDVFCINGNKSSINRKQRIIGIMPNYIVWENEDKSRSVEFRTNEKFGLRMSNEYKTIWKMMHWFDMKIANPLKVPELNFGFDTLTVYSGGATAVDGIVKRDIASELWATIKAGAGTSADDTPGTVNNAFYTDATGTVDQYGQLIRSILTFDTSSLLSTYTINSALFSGRFADESGGGAGNSFANQFSLNVYSSSPNSDTALIASDYGQLGSTEFSVSISRGTILSDGAVRQTFALNSSGEANINKGGISRFGIRESNFDAKTATPVWSNSAEASILMYYSAASGTSDDPYLQITFTYPASGSKVTHNARNLIYFGNENLQKNIYNVSVASSRNASPALPQEIPAARANGSTVVNTRLGAKSIGLQGVLSVKDNPDNLQELMRDYDAIFETTGNQYLRVCPGWKNIIATSSTSAWTASDDATNLTAKSDKWQNPVGNTSLGFDMIASGSANNYATLTFLSTTQTDLSDVKNTGNFEFALYIPDTFYVTSVDFKIGNDSSNYYSYSFTSDYQGKTISNGTNVFSVGWSDNTFPRPDKRVSETGTVATNVIDYCVIQINYSSTAGDVYGCYLDNIMWINEDRARNFQVYRQGEIEKSANHFNITFTQFEANFLNYTGYANSTHSFELYDISNVTAESDSTAVVFEGSINPLPQLGFDISTSTNLGDFDVTNLNTNQTLSLEPSAIVNGDSLDFGGLQKVSTQNANPMDFSGVIPDFKLGKTRINLGLAGGDTSTITQLTTTGSQITGGGSPLPAWDAGNAAGTTAQSFTADLTGPVSYIEVYISGIGPGFPTDTEIEIWSDSAGSPGTKIAGTTIEAAGWSRWTSPGIEVTSTVKYWILIGGGNFIWWFHDITGTYASGEAKKYTGSWGSAETYDYAFTVKIGQTPAWKIAWDMNYKKLYAS